VPDRRQCDAQAVPVDDELSAVTYREFVKQREAPTAMLRSLDPPPCETAGLATHLFVEQ